MVDYYSSFSIHRRTPNQALKTERLLDAGAIPARSASRQSGSFVIDR